MNEHLAAPAPIDFEHAQLASNASTLSCAACERPIAQTYYSINSRFVCPSCHEQLLSAARTGGTFGAALLFGTGAAALGAALYYGVAAITGYEVGLVAIVVGLMVGKAIRKGAGMQRSKLYRVLALLLTYLAIAGANIPTLMALDGVDSLTEATILALIMPAMMIRSTGGALGLLIMGIGLYESWKYSAAPVFNVQGPFEHAASTATPAPVAAGILV